MKLEMCTRYVWLVVIFLLLPSCGCGTDFFGLESPPLEPPSVRTVTPGDGGLDVALDTEIVVIFTGLLMEPTVNDMTFLLIERNGQIVPGTIVFTYPVIDGETRLQATFIPGADLLPCTTYDIVVSAAVQDLLGQHLTAFGSSFTTTGVDCAPPPPPGACLPEIDFGTAGTFAVMAGSTITNTGATTVDGDLGLSPGDSVTGAPLVMGQTHIADAIAVQAQNDLITAYNAAAAMPSTATRVGDIGGEILFAGVYTSTSTLAVERADLVLVGGPDDVFVFQMASSLNIGSGRKVVLQGVRPCNVVWQVGSSATLGTGADFSGSILALTSITLETGAVSDGRVLARNGAVTMDTNFVAAP